MQDKITSEQLAKAIIQDFLGTDEPTAHLDRLEEMLIHRLVYTDEHDLSQASKQNMQWTFLCMKELITKAAKLPSR